MSDSLGRSGVLTILGFVLLRGKEAGLLYLHTGPSCHWLLAGSTRVEVAVGLPGTRSSLHG